MRKQEKLIDNKSNQEVRLYYKEIRTQEKLSTATISNSNKVRDIKALVSDIRAKGGRKHTVDELSNSIGGRNIFIWAQKILEEQSEKKELIQYISNDFKTHLKKRAIERGKYFVALCLDHELLIFHTHTKQKTLTTNADLIDRLLDTHIINKYARFYITSNTLTVEHFDEYRTDGFSKWLGIPYEELNIGEIGNIHFYTVLAGNKYRITLSEEDAVEAILNSESMRISADSFQLNNKNFPLEKIRWGEEYKNGYTFLETLKAKQLGVKRHQKKYEEICKELTRFLQDGTVRDYASKVEGNFKDKIYHKNVRKEIKLNVIFANKQIRLAPKYGQRIIHDFIHGKEIAFFHAGSEEVFEPQKIGSFRFLSDLDISERDRKNIHSLASTVTKDTSTGFEEVLTSVIFCVLSDLTKEPLSPFLSQLSKFAIPEYNFTSHITTLEGLGGIEYKSWGWIYNSEGKKISPENLTKKLQKEMNNDTNIALIGFNEEEGRIETRPSSIFKHEFLQTVEDESKTQNGWIKLYKLPVGDKKCLLAAYIHGQKSRTKEIEQSMAYIEQ